VSRIEFAGLKRRTRPHIIPLAIGSPQTSISMYSLITNS
jgi:hypothetical protein